MKLWPEKRWKKILFSSIIIVLVLFVSLSAYAFYTINNDVVTDLVIENPSGGKTALVLYHPGLSTFAHDASYAFAKGLVSNGWRVEIATPSNEAPTDIIDYSLLVFCVSTYAGQPDSPSIRHLDRMGNLAGIDTVILALAAGTAEGSKGIMQEAITSANGTIIRSIALYNMVPNEGNKSAGELAEQAGKEIFP